MLSLLISTALASSFFEQPFPDTVRATPNIVRGRIGKSEAQWTTLPNGAKHLFTYYDVEVSERLKGKARSGSIRIRELGGEKDGVSLQVSGTARFTTGEDVVVMLGEPSASGDGAFPVTGMMMGKYTVEKGADGKEYLRGPGLGGSVHPELRNENSPSAGKAQIALEAVREIIREQASEPAIAPSATPNPSGDGLLASKATPAMPTMVAPTPDHTDRGEGSSRTGGRASSPILFLIGAVIGVMWFLKSRRKKR